MHNAPNQPDDVVVHVWYIAPSGHVTRPMTVVMFAPGDDVSIMFGNLSKSRGILRASVSQAHGRLIETNGVKGLAITDPHWDGNDTFYCSHCKRVETVDSAVAANLFQRASTGQVG